MCMFRLIYMLIIIFGMWPAEEMNSEEGFTAVGSLVDISPIPASARV
jgi:hypothetical protein